MKKVLILLFFLANTHIYSQNYEVYVGSVISEDKDMHVGYELGANFIIKTNQNRKYLNNLLLGFSHQGFMSNNIQSYIDDNNLSITHTDCNCTTETLSITNSSYISKKMVRAVTLNIGIEIANRWYLISGVSNLQHINFINNEKINDYRTMQIDAGVKYFIKSNDWYFSPMVKFNPETISFSIGIAR